MKPRLTSKDFVLVWAAVAAGIGISVLMQVLGIPHWIIVLILVLFYLAFFSLFIW